MSKKPVTFFLSLLCWQETGVCIHSSRKKRKRWNYCFACRSLGEEKIQTKLVEVLKFTAQTKRCQSLAYKLTSPTSLFVSFTKQQKNIRLLHPALKLQLISEKKALCQNQKANVFKTSFSGKRKRVKHIWPSLSKMRLQKPFLSSRPESNGKNKVLMRSRGF